ncbi:cytochrome P450 [Phialemonium atrogriseum]|uniref:Cytochrome P450 n=1 Tax=Phialemonium atrogriseum TaxID=1093897 RepID=A0AAJ0BQM9_9PEZI|nr:cytochrome P450 [Phialemonium atrogriseum]KAK1762684.1 cytochrome P450 [Phialemonium atrogriseum]
MMGQYHNSSFVVYDTQPLGHWSLWALTYSILAVIPFTLFYLLQASGGSKLPTLNSKRAFEFFDKRVKRNFRVNGRQLLREGLEKFNGQPFRILTDHGPTIILPPSYAQEIRNLGDLNHVKAIAKFVHPEYPGFEAFHEFAYGDDIIQDVVRSKVTQCLGTITKPLSEETAMTLRDCFTDDEKWHPISLHETVLHAVARVSSRLFLGDRLCRDPEWLHITTTYTHHIAKAILELNTWPALLRPLVHRFLRRNRELIHQVQEAHRVMGKVLDERRALKAAGQSPEYIDAIEWFEQVAKGRKYDPVHVQLTLSFVAIHTTADMITQLMFDLAQNPEYIQPLREEVIDVLGKLGWKKTSLYNLKLLDSVLKESQRLRPINDTSLQRLALRDVKLSDGTVLPRGSISAVASTRHWDSHYYPDPHKFDGYRFLKMRTDGGKENVAQFVSTSPDHLGFGHGQHACPGRFFASNEIKIIMCHILLKYDWRLIKGQDPKAMVHGFILAADHTTKLEIQRRREELDIDSL